MITRSTLLLALPLLAACASQQQPALPTSNLSIADRHEILSQRSRWNAAFAERRIDDLLKLVTDDFTLAIGPGIFSGRDVVIGGFQTLFEKRPDLEFIRHPVTVEGHAAWGLAYEIGWWEERWPEGGELIELEGSYMAMWRRTDAGWLQRSETFVPASCTGGSYCEPHNESPNPSLQRTPPE